MRRKMKRFLASALAFTMAFTMASTGVSASGIENKDVSAQSVESTANNTKTDNSKKDVLKAGTNVAKDDSDTLFFEDFENGEVEGWTFIDADGDGYDWSVLERNGDTCHSGLYVLTSASYINDFGAITPDNWAIMPAVTLPAAAELSFWMRGQDANWASEHMQVYVGTEPTVDSMQALSEELIGTGEYVEYVYDLSEYGNQGEVYIGFRHFNVTDMFMINVDDICIKSSYNPDVDYLVNISSNIQNGTVTATPSYGQAGDLITLSITPDLTYELDELFVTCNGDEVDFVIEDDEYSFEMPEGDVEVYASFIATANFVLYEDFEHDGELPEDWTFIDADGDENNWAIWDSTQNDVYSGSYALSSESYINNVGALTPDNWAITPAITIPYGASLSFWMNGQDASWAAEHMQVYVGTEPTVDAMIDHPLSSELIATGDVEQYLIGLDDSEGQTIYIGFRHYNVTDMFRLNLEDVAVYAPIEERGPVVMNYVKASFDGKLGMAFFAEVPDWLKIQENAYVTLTQCGVTKTQKISDIVANGTNADGLYRIATYMPAAYYRDTVVLRFYDNAGDPVQIIGSSSGNDLTESGITYTLQKYASRIMTTGSDTEKALAKAMDDYCTAAQIYFEHNTTNENLTLSSAVSGVTQSDLSGYVSSRGGDLTSKIKSFSLTASFESDNTLKLGITFAGNGNKAANMKYYVSEDGTLENAVETTLRGSKTNGYYLAVRNVPGAYLDKPYTFFMVDQDTNQTYYLTCSICTYARAVAFNNNYDDNTHNLAKALYLYNKATKAYFGLN